MARFDANILGERIRAAIRESIAASNAITAGSFDNARWHAAAALAEAPWHTLTKSAFAVKAWLAYGEAERFEVRYAADEEIETREENRQVWFRATVEAELVAGQIDEEVRAAAVPMRWQVSLPDEIRRQASEAVGFGAGEEARFETGFGTIAVRPAVAGAGWSYAAPGERPVKATDTGAPLGAILAAVEILRRMADSDRYVSRPMRPPAESDPNPVRCLLHHLIGSANEALASPVRHDRLPEGLARSLTRMSALTLSRYDVDLHLQLTGESIEPTIAKARSFANDFSLRLSARVTAGNHGHEADDAAGLTADLRVEVPDLLAQGPLAEEFRGMFLASNFALQAYTDWSAELKRRGYACDAERIRSWMALPSTEFLTIRLERRTSYDLNLFVLSGPYEGTPFVALSLAEVTIRRGDGTRVLIGSRAVRFGPQAPFSQSVRLRDGASDIAAKLRRCLLALEAWRKPLA
jgi:hypothetical protein